MRHAACCHFASPVAQCESKVSCMSSLSGPRCASISRVVLCLICGQSYTWHLPVRLYTLLALQYSTSIAIIAVLHLLFFCFWTVSIAFEKPKLKIGVYDNSQLALHIRSYRQIFAHIFGRAKSVSQAIWLQNDNLYVSCYVFTMVLAIQSVFQSPSDKFLRQLELTVCCRLGSWGLVVYHGR